MEYEGIKFDAIVATPACGKSFLCDKYPGIFVDVDEVRLKCKYFVPENITRKELEETKGDRKFAKRFENLEYISLLNEKLDEYVKEGKTLIAAPHDEAINYLLKNNIKFCFVYQSKDMKTELENRMRKRLNSEKVIKENSDKFDYFYNSNKKENKSVVHYEFGPNEYLEDIIKKFGYKF